MTTLRLRRGRGDAKLEQLNEEQTQQLLTWLQDENSTYVNVAALVKEHFGVSVGKSAVGRYWRRHIFPRSFLEEAGVKGKLETMPMEKFEDAFAKVATLAAEKALERPHPPIQLVLSLVKIVSVTKRDGLARRKLDHKERRLEIDEEKTQRKIAAQAKQYMTPEEEMQSLTYEEQVELARKIYGEVPEEEDATRKKCQPFSFPKGFGQISPLFPAESHVDGDARSDWSGESDMSKQSETPARPWTVDEYVRHHEKSEEPDFATELPPDLLLPPWPLPPGSDPGRLRGQDAMDAEGNRRKRKPREVPDDDFPHPDTLDYSEEPDHEQAMTDAWARAWHQWRSWCTGIKHRPKSKIKPGPVDDRVYTRTRE
ncbi:MAG TPA: hypothetical protein VGE76_13095 [Opitutaceae bacterium]